MEASLSFHVEQFQWFKSRVCSSRTSCGISPCCRGRRWSPSSQNRTSGCHLQHCIEYIIHNIHNKLCLPTSPIMSPPGQETKLVHTLSDTQCVSPPARRSVPLLQMKLTPLEPASSVASNVFQEIT